MTAVPIWLSETQHPGRGEQSTTSLETTEVQIVPRTEVEAIDPVAWDLLADHSCVPNPFYERWNLLPAVRHLDKKDSVFVVAVYRSGCLVCLFPVLLKRKAWSLPYLSIWQFNGCMVSDVLYEAGVSLAPIFRDVMRRLRSPIMVSGSHSWRGFDVASGCSYCRTRRLRKAVIKATDWDAYQRRLQSKHRKESARVTKRLMDLEGAQYVTSDSGLSEKWLPLYLAVERQSRKAMDGRSLISDIDNLQYFTEAVQEGERRKKIEFQGLVIGDDVLAMSIRFRAQRNAYEIKTSYVEKYRKLYPGVVLELLNVRHVLNGRYAAVDSCGWKNRVVERVWPDDIEVYRTVVFKKSLLGMLAQLVYKRYRYIRIRQDRASLTCN